VLGQFQDLHLVSDTSVGTDITVFGLVPLRQMLRSSAAFTGSPFSYPK
jgi:hypothetical protein